MQELTVVIDQLNSPVPGGIGRYTVELTRSLIDTAPDGAAVVGLSSRVGEQGAARLTAALPDLSGIRMMRLPQRLLTRAWRHGLALPAVGSLHAPGLLAPLSATGTAVRVVTIHDIVPFTHPETLTPNGVRWHRAMIARAWRYADAVVTSTEAVAAQLMDIHDFDDRMRVIPGAVSTSRLALLASADAVAARLDLPEQYLLFVGTLEPRKGLSELIRALHHVPDPTLPLLIAGPPGWGSLDVTEIARSAGLPEGRVRTLGFLTEEELVVVQSRALALVMPSFAEGFGLPLLEAMQLGTPVIHSDDPALVEVAGGAGLIVPVEPIAGYPERLAAAIGALDDTDRRVTLQGAGPGRSAHFSWDASARAVWTLHRDLA